MGRFNLAEHIQAAQPAAPRDIETITGEILDAKRAGGEAILTIGRGLMEAKAMLSHGEWLPWLEERVEFSEKAAQRFMLLARKYSNPTTLSDLGASKALLLLALPDGERDEFIEVTHVVDGEEKTVGDMSVRELRAAIKERDEARMAAERARAEQSAAEAAREKLSADMAMANERIAGLNAEVEQRAAEAQKSAEEAARLERELADLRARPVEVAVERDEAAIEAARKEGEEKSRADLLEVNSALQRAKLEHAQALDKARKAKERAEQARKEAEEARAAAQAELERVQAEAQAVREQAARAEKRASAASDTDVVLFAELFDRAQEDLNRVNGVLMKLRNRDPETAGKLAQAVAALLDRTKEAVGA